MHVCGSRRARINHRYARNRSEAADLERKRERVREGQVGEEEMERGDEKPKDESGAEDRDGERVRRNSGRYIATKTKLTECQNFFVIKFFASLAVSERGGRAAKGAELPGFAPAALFRRGMCMSARRHH